MRASANAIIMGEPLSITGTLAGLLLADKQ